MKSMKVWLLMVLTSLIVVVVWGSGCSATQDEPEEEEVSAQQALTLLSYDDIDSYADTDDMHDKSGGVGWNSNWEVVAGSVTVTDDQAHTGSLSMRFAGSSGNVISRAMGYTTGDMVEVYIYAPSSLDAMANFELRSEYWSTMFVGRFNYLTAGRLEVYHYNSSTWVDVAPFTPNAWNKLGYRVDPDTGDVDVYLNDTEVASDYPIWDPWWTVGRVLFESLTANGAVVYMDSPQQMSPLFETFESYSDNDSLDAKAGGAGWSSNWDVLSGSVTVTDDQAQQGTYSIKFGATSGDVVTRDFDLPEDQLFEVYVYAPSSLDAMGSVELRDGTNAMFLARFNYQSAGQISVYDHDTMSWSTAGAFNANAWNKLQIMVDSSDGKADVYLNGSLAASDLGSLSGSGLSVDRLILESSTANSEVLYMDSPKVIMP